MNYTLTLTEADLDRLPPDLRQRAKPKRSRRGPAPYRSAVVTFADGTRKCGGAYAHDDKAAVRIAERFARAVYVWERVRTNPFRRDICGDAYLTAAERVRVPPVVSVDLS